MEVHAHTHPSPGSGHRKKWTHYFWEFLMLFLAVTLGFFVENRREHYIERERAKEYAKTMIGDLTKDSIEILDVIRETRLIIKGFDSIAAAIQSSIKENQVMGSFYSFCKAGSGCAIVLWNDATLTQVTQSGNMRYFNDIGLVNKISAYYSLSGYIRDLNYLDRGRRERSNELKSRILNSYFYSRYSLYAYNTPDSLMRIKTPLQSYDDALLNEYANSFEMRRAHLTTLIETIYPKALNAASELITLLKKEYHLK